MDDERMDDDSVKSSALGSNRISQEVEEAVARARDSSRIVEEYGKDEKWLIDLHGLDSSILDAIFPKQCSLLDAMMGPGRHVMHFARKGYEVWGNDYNKHMVAAAGDALRKAGLLRRKKPGVRLFNLDATCLNQIPSNRFDGVLCMGSSLGCIPNSANRRRAFSEFARAAKPGGLVVAHLNNRYSMTWADLETLWFWIRHRHEGYEFGDIVFYHGEALGDFFNHIFSVGEARSLCASAGLVMEGFVCFNRHQTGLLPRYLPKWISGGFLVISRKPPIKS